MCTVLHVQYRHVQYRHVQYRHVEHRHVEYRHVQYRYVQYRYVQYRYSCPILMKLEFSRHFFKNSQILNFTKIRPVGAELFHADRRTERRIWRR